MPMIRPSHLIECCVFALLGLGVVMVHSAGASLAGGGPGSDPLWVLTSRHTFLALLAVAAFGVASRLDVVGMLRTPALRNPLYGAALGSILLLGLIRIPGVGRTVNGATRWLAVGPLAFQPSEAVKWLGIVALACACGRLGAGAGRFRIAGGLMLAVAGACGMIVMEDFGTGALLAAAAGGVLLAGGVRVWQLALSAVPGIGLMAWGLAESSYRMARLTAFMDPWADPQGTGYHAIRSMAAISGGGVLGRGLGGGVEKLGYLPEATTDFLFAVISEELGLAGVLLVVTLYAVLAGAGLRVAFRAADPAAALVALGVVTVLVLQALMNMAVVTVLVPTTGIPLPLVSAGGTGWVMTALALGLVAAIDRDAAADAEAAAEEAPPAPLSGERAP